MPERQVIGVALGSGAARGWAHVGVLKALAEAGIRPQVLCGTSAGALIGAAYLTDQIDPLLAWSTSIGWLGALRMVDVSFRRGGLMLVERVFERFRNTLTDVDLGQMAPAFATVATDLETGREVWLRTGPLLDAVRASTAIPGLFPAVRLDGHWLVDGALVNPVPVSLCRAMGATHVIAVNLNGDSVGLKIRPAPRPPRLRAAAARTARDLLVARLTGVALEAGPAAGGAAAELPPPAAAGPPAPSILDVLAGSIDIMQDRITRARLAGEPPEVLIAPRLGHIGILEFDRAEEMVEIGRAAAQAMMPAITMALA